MTLDNDYVLPDWSSRRALGNVGTVTGNSVSDCYLGLVAVPSGALRISDNTISNCVRPIVVGENEYDADSSTVVENSIAGCVFPPEVDGQQILLRLPDEPTVSIGPDRSIGVVDSLLTMPVGTVITFDCGAVLTLTTPVKTSNPYIAGSPLELRGTVTVADIPPNAYGIVTGPKTPAQASAAGDGNQDPNGPRVPHPPPAEP